MFAAHCHLYSAGLSMDSPLPVRPVSVRSIRDPRESKAEATTPEIPEDIVSLAEEADEYLVVECDQIATMRHEIERQEDMIRALKAESRLKDALLEKSALNVKSKNEKVRMLHKENLMCEEQIFQQETELHDLRNEVRRAEMENEEKGELIARLQEQLRKLTTRKRSSSVSQFLHFFTRRNSESRSEDSAEEDVEMVPLSKSV
ncbi:hypothetical protein L596_017919 [Steinernema carpocapsae]|uniref:Uncharacterized protein n=1 Tax=Steinernema carpocapsae TaxID=34508 RepID=A0A4U5N3C3_STECR|nr:hypothetical protein L596_017919 [Steinernema carpocapsae]